MKISSETRFIVFFLILLGTVSLVSSLWFLREKEKARQQYVERESQLMVTINSLRSDLSQAKAKSQELEGQARDLNASLEARSREVEELKAKYSLLFKDKSTLQKELEKIREEKLSMEERVKRLETSPFLAKVLTEKNSFDQDAEGLKGMIEKSQAELVRITEERNALEDRLEEIQAGKSKIEEKLRQEQEKLGTMTTDLEKERTGRLTVAESMSDNIAKVKREKETLERELARVTEERVDMERQLEEARGRIQEINEKREDLTQQIREVNQILQTRLGEINQIRSVYEKTIEEARQIAKLEQGVVELPPIVVKGDTASGNPVSSNAPSAVAVQQKSKEAVKQGEVLGVNDKYRFVVINLGQKDGIQDGTLFHVLREGKEIGQLKVIEARQEISACDIVKGPANLGAPRQGDVVVQ